MSTVRRPGMAIGDPEDRLGRRQQSTGEDVLLDPRVRVAAGQHPVVRHGDGLNRDPPAGHHQPVQRLKVRGPEPVSDRLDHLHGQHGVVAAVDVAVIAQVDLDAVGQSRRGHPLTGQSLLLGGQRDRTDLRASRRRPDAQFAPARADFEHSAARPDARGVEESVDLAPLGLGEARCLAGGQAVEQRAGVRHGLVEELGEQVVGQVVVLGDVEPRLRAAVVLRIAAGAPRRSGRNRCRTDGTNSVSRLANSVSTPDEIGRSSSRRPCRTRRNR